MPSWVFFDAKQTGYSWTNSLLNFSMGLEEESREKLITFLVAQAKTPALAAASEAERPLQTRPICVPLCPVLPLLFSWTRSSSGRLLRLFLFTLYFTLGANRDVYFEVQGETLTFITGFLLTLSEICHQWAFKSFSVLLLYIFPHVTSAISASLGNPDMHGGICRLHPSPSSAEKEFESYLPSLSSEVNCNKNSHSEEWDTQSHHQFIAVMAKQRETLLHAVGGFLH